MPELVDILGTLMLGRVIRKSYAFVTVSGITYGSVLFDNSFHAHSDERRFESTVFRDCALNALSPKVFYGNTYAQLITVLTATYPEIVIKALR